MEDFAILKAEKRDQEAIFKLVEKVLKDYELKTDPLETDKDLFDLSGYYFNNKGWFGVMKDPVRGIVGSYGLFRIDSHTCELRKMYLYPEYQGKGLGRKMLLHALEKAKNLGYTEMILETNGKLDKAIGLYKKYGFELYQPDHLSARCDLSMKKIL